MLRVTIELLSAITGETSKLGVAFLSNDGKGTRERGNYDVRVMRKGVESPLGKATREGRVEDYPRLAYSVWRLVARGLHAAFPEEREPGIAKLNASVMGGLKEIARLARLAGIPSGSMYDDRTHGEVSEALAWIDAGNAESDDVTYVGDALGCGKPAGDAREEFQRSIFRGLKLLAAGYSREHGEQINETQAGDVLNARTFVNALPV